MSETTMPDSEQAEPAVAPAEESPAPPAEEQRQATPEPSPYVPPQPRSRSAQEPPREETGPTDPHSRAEQEAKRTRAVQNGDVPEAEPATAPGIGEKDPADADQIYNAGRQALLNSNTIGGVVTTGDNSNAIQVRNEITVRMPGGEVRILTSTLKTEFLESMPSFCVDAACVIEASGALRTYPAILLRGPADSGRRTAALRILYLAGAKHVVTMNLDAGATVASLHDSSLYEAGRGYVVELRGGIDREQFISLRDLVGSRNAYLVILARKPGATDRRLVGGDFNYLRPGTEEVFRKHVVVQLERHLGEDYCTRQTNEDYARERLDAMRDRQGFHLPTEMTELAVFAKAVADVRHDESAWEGLAARVPSNLRGTAMEALSGDRSADPAADTSRKQALRISFAAFHGMPLSDAFSAADLLGQYIVPAFETRETVADHRLFDLDVSAILGENFALDVAGGPAESPRRARLASPSLLAVLLDVAWNEFDTLRGPIMTWLKVLLDGEHPGRMHARAAELAGVLATFDFEEVYRVLLGPWARSGLRYRLAAAVALGLASTDPRLTPRVRSQVRDWARSSNPLLQDCAALAYGTWVGADIPELAIAALRELGAKPSLSASRSVPKAMASLFGVNAATPSMVIDEIRRWAQGDNVHLKRHAARALTIIVRQARSSQAYGRSALDEVLGQDCDRLTTVAALWRDAMVGSDTAGQAWEPIRRWIVDAEQAADSLETVERLAVEIFRDAGDRRAFFHLLLWRHRSPDSRTLQRIYDEITSTNGQGRNSYER